MRTLRTIVALVLVCGVFPAAALAAARVTTPVVINGKSYPSWTSYFLSDEFQSGGLRCGTPDPFQRSERSPGLKDASDCSLDSTNPSEEYAPGNIYEITMIVHRLESILGDGVFPDSLVKTQIDVLNEDYQAIMGTPGEPGTDTRFRFKLATQDPEGNPSPGWTRTTNEFWFNDQPDPLNGMYYDALAWDPNRYLNIYTLSPVAPGGVVLGYVPFFPQDGGAGTNEDGVRCLWNAFGRPSDNAPYDLGRTVTHEVGHYFGLYHTFQDECGTGTVPGCFSSGDRICDTEPDSVSHGGCPTNAATCGDPDPIRNYMEYTDDLCMTNFTPQQARRMICTTRFYRPLIYQEIPVVAVGGETVRGPRAQLAQNWPNPFGPSTQFSFELPSAGVASVAVLDVAGRLVRTLASGSMNAGGHTLRWNGVDERNEAAGPGIYFYRLTTAESSVARRMILITH